MGSMFLIVQTFTRRETNIQRTIQIWEGLLRFLWLFRDVLNQDAPLGLSHRIWGKMGISETMTYVNENVKKCTSQQYLFSQDNSHSQ